MTILPDKDAGRKAPVIEVPGKPVPDAWGRVDQVDETTSRERVHEASLRLVEAGLSIIPVEGYEGSKSPDTLRLPHPRDSVTGKPKSSWSAFQFRRPSTDELRRWYEISGVYGLAVLGGTVSGGQYGCGLEVIDFDDAELAEPWAEEVGRQAPGLVARLVRVLTPRPGMHVYYRCTRYGVCQKLAFGAVKDDFGNSALDEKGRPARKTLVEMKAEGGYCLIPPSPARCHPSMRLYRYAEGSPELTAVPTITPEERELLLKAARSLNRWQEPLPKVQPPKAGRKASGSLLPGDDFNARASWADILTPHGWKMVGRFGEEQRWCRPGKEDGVSATVNHNGSGLLHVFSSSVEKLEADRSYSKFTAYAHLEHKGDFKKAAAELRKQGYGKKDLGTGKR